MFFDRIRLVDFKNYSELDLRFDKDLNIFIGKNGQGKTNLLEAISMSVGGSPFRSLNSEQFIRSGQKKALIEANLLQTQGLSDSIKIEFLGNKKSTYLNEKKTKKQDLWKKFGTVNFSPESLRVIKLGPIERRHFIDEMLISMDPDQWSAYSHYSKAIKQRNALLKKIKETQKKTPKDQNWLDSMTEGLLEFATEIALLRGHYLTQIQPLIRTFSKFIFGLQNVDISVEYVNSKGQKLALDKNQVYDAYRSELREKEAVEIRVGQTLWGPHKHDFLFMFNRHDARYYCSQGQQRALLLAFKIAHLNLFKQKTGRKPLLLLDDVMSELDKEKRFQLIELFLQNDAQIFLTTTDIESLKFLPQDKITISEIHNGKIFKQRTARV